MGAFALQQVALGRAKPPETVGLDCEFDWLKKCAGGE